MTNVAGLQAKLLNIARQTGLEFQLLLNRFGAEQFLVRLSESPFVEKFIFKGGSLLTYLIETERRTKDLDFTVKQLGNQVDDVVSVIKSVLAIPMDDGLEWGEIEGYALQHPDMDYPGVRIICRFLLGKMRGRVQMDMAIGEVLEAVRMPLKRIRYKEQPLMGPDFSLLSYPLELIFAEKLQIAVDKGEDNTRMRDYYDLFKLSQEDLDMSLLGTCLDSAFVKRKNPLIETIPFDEKTISKLQTYWERYALKSRLKDAPRTIGEIIAMINGKLKEIPGK